MRTVNLAAAVASRDLVWQAAVIAWILSVPLYFVTKFVLVLAHEGGHAFVGLALLNRIKRITFNRAGGGGTEFVEPVGWPFAILVGFAGYAGPSLFGLMAAGLLRRGQPAMVLWGSMVFLLLMLIVVRGWVGWVVVPALLVGLYQVVTKAEGERLTLFAYVWTWFLLIAAVQRMLVYIDAATFRDKESDTAKLQKMTFLPSVVWTFAHLLGTSAALVWGGSMLLRQPT